MQGTEGGAGTGVAHSPTDSETGCICSSGSRADCVPMRNAFRIPPSSLSSKRDQGQAADRRPLLSIGGESTGTMIAESRTTTLAGEFAAPGTELPLVAFVRSMLAPAV